MDPKEPKPSTIPPEHPVTKPDTKPETEKNIPFHPSPEIQPVHIPEIQPGRSEPNGVF